MVEPINDPFYWESRWKSARLKGEIHHAIFKCDRKRWDLIAAKHREILAQLITPDATILDAGCGWGRLLTLLPKDWDGYYLGVDLSPTFIEYAEETSPDTPRIGFLTANLQDETLPRQASFFLPGKLGGVFDWAVLISMRPMVIRNLGKETWDKMEANLRKCCRRLLYLEYDPEDPGSIE